MEYRMLGRTGVPVSALCLGCMNFGRTTPEDESIRMMHYAKDQGVNFFRHRQRLHLGVSETIVGKALQGGRRDRLVLATKVRGAMSDNAAGRGQQPAPHHPAVRGFAEAPGHRLDRPLPDSPAAKRPRPRTRRCARSTI